MDVPTTIFKDVFTFGMLRRACQAGSVGVLWLFVCQHRAGPLEVKVTRKDRI